MITQVIWADVNDRELDSVYARSGDEEIREIQFIICRNDPPEKVEIPAGVSGQFRMIKSSGNFVVRDMTKTVHEDGTVIFTVAVSDQMVNVQGTGYYDIRLSGGGYLYTASGRFIVDTPVISSGVLEDVSEVNGVIFPDDFYTKNDHVAVIDDNSISNDSTWSSEKISDQINIIDDNTVSTNNTWSSEKINDEIKDNSGKHEYSTNEKVVGKWIDGKTVYEMVVTNLSARTSGTNWTSINTIDASTWDNIIDAKLFRTLNSGKMGALPIAEYTIIDGHPNITLVSDLFDSVVTTAIFTYTKTTPTRKKVIK